MRSLFVQNDFYRGRIFGCVVGNSILFSINLTKELYFVRKKKTVIAKPKISKKKIITVFPGKIFLLNVIIVKIERGEGVLN